MPVVPPARTVTHTSGLPDDRYLNRELSWLDFNARVLALAEDPSQPLLERAKFLAIFASNLDEFYMVRVAGLKRRDEAGLQVRSADGLTPREQLARISARTQALAVAHAKVFLDEVCPELDKEGIRINRWSSLTDGQRATLSTYFTETVFPVLTPLAVDPAHPFPYISGLSLNLAVTVRDPQGRTERFARVKVPNNVPRLVRVAPEDPDDESITFLPIEDLIAAHLSELFTGMEVAECHAFRVTRNADLEVEEDRDEDLLQALERELARRRFGPPVRLEVVDTMSPHVLELLLRELDVDPHDVVTVPGLLDLTALWRLVGVDRPDLKDEPFRPATAPRFRRGRDREERLRHAARGRRPRPPPVRLVRHQRPALRRAGRGRQERARDQADALPDVGRLPDRRRPQGRRGGGQAGRRAGGDQGAVRRAGQHPVGARAGALGRARRLRARRPQDALQDLPGGAPGGQHIRRYCHIGTGNYNPKTARLYEDLGVLTADPAIGEDLTDLFNALTGYSRQTSYQSLLVAPYGVRRGIIRRIEDEIEAHREGKDARIRIKVNSLVDEQVIDALYRASQAGVPVDVVVRGICAIRPGREGLSENIHVRSILGRYLEHSRVFHFGAADEYWIGSADMMHRNLDRRVEVLLRVAEPKLAGYLRRCSTRASTPRPGAGRSRRRARGGRRRRRTRACRRCATTRPR